MCSADIKPEVERLFAGILRDIAEALCPDHPESVRVGPVDFGGEHLSPDTPGRGSARPGSDPEPCGEYEHRWSDDPYDKRRCVRCGVLAGAWDAPLPTIDDIAGTVGLLGEPQPRRMRHPDPEFHAVVGEHDQDKDCWRRGCVPVIDEGAETP